jgi:hypothetical protein
MILQILLVMFAGWLQHRQQRIVTSLAEENCILKAQFRDRRLRLPDTEHRLAALAYPLGRESLKGITTIAPRHLYTLVSPLHCGEVRRELPPATVSLGNASSWSSVWPQRILPGATDAARAR